MLTRGIYDRKGEMFAYVDNDRIYDLEGKQTGIIRDKVGYDLDDNRLWLIDGDAICDLKGIVTGYMGQPAREGD